MSLVERVCNGGDEVSHGIKVVNGMNRRRTLAMAVLLAVMCLPGLALTGFFAAGAVLSAPAEDPRPADVVVVLGGDWAASGVTRRYALGRDLVLAGHSKRLILIYPSADDAKDARDRLQNVEIVAFLAEPSSWSEAIDLRDRMQAEGLRSVMVVSDPPHMLRLRYTWGSVMRGTGLHYTLVATSPSWWPGWRWWRNPQASDFVGSEVIKLGYYLVKYRFGF